MIKNRIKVSICGASYSLVADEQESHLVQAAKNVDSAMHSVIEAGVIEHEKAAVLVALQLASNILKQEEYERRKAEEIQRLIEKIECETHFLTQLS